MTDPRIIVAIDTYDLQEANVILDQLDPDLCKIKMGSVVFNSLGKSFLKEVSSRGFKIFLDLKLHDIPNTVYEAILGFHNCSIDMLTVHLSGGEEIVKGLTLIENFSPTIFQNLIDFDHGFLFISPAPNVTKKCTRDNLGIGKDYELIYVTNEEAAS